MKNKIKVLRAMNDLTQADLAEKVGVSRQTISYLETGRYMPSLKIAYKIAKIFGVPIEEIFELDDEE